MECDGAEAVRSERDPAEGFDVHIEHPGLCQSKDGKERPSLSLRKETQTLLRRQEHRGMGRCERGKAKGWLSGDGGLKQGEEFEEQ